jgi:tetratricopeptide (TPR) repeat protein
VSVSDSGAVADSGALDLERASALIDLGRPDEAASILAGVLGRTPDDDRAWRAMARARLAGGDRAGALEAARTAIALNPDDGLSYLVGAASLSQLGDSSGAEAMAREAVRLAPNNWGSHAMLGGILARRPGRVGRRGRRREAADCGARALALAPHSADAQASWGSIAMAIGRRPDAQAAFDEALRLDPQHSVTHNELARLRLGRGGYSPQRLAQAAGGFSTAVRVDPRARDSQANVKLVMHSAISMTTYLVFLVAWLLRPTDNADSATWRLLPVLALLVPAYFAWRFWHGLTPPLRTYLGYLLTKSELRIPSGLAGAAVLCMLAGAVAPHGARQVLTFSAVLLALAARVWLGVRSPRLADGRHPLLSMRVLWVLVVLLGGSALIMVGAAAEGPDRAPELVAAAVLAAATAGLLVLVRRRRASRRPARQG